MLIFLDWSLYDHPFIAGVGMYALIGAWEDIMMPFWKKC